MYVRIDYASHKKPPLILYCFRNLESCKISRRPSQGFQPILLSCLSASNTKLKSGNHRLNGRHRFHKSNFEIDPPFLHVTPLLRQRIDDLLLKTLRRKRQSERFKTERVTGGIEYGQNQNCQACEAISTERTPQYGTLKSQHQQISWLLTGVSHVLSRDIS